TYAPIVPGRLRIPVIQKIQPMSRRKGRLHGESRRSLDILGREQVGDVDFATFECGKARRVVWNDAEDQALDGRRLPPVSVEGLRHDSHAGCEGPEAVRPRPDRRPLEAVVTDLLDVLFRNDPASPGCQCAVKDHEIGPWPLQPDPNSSWIGCFDPGHMVLEN